MINSDNLQPKFSKYKKTRRNLKFNGFVLVTAYYQRSSINQIKTIQKQPYIRKNHQPKKKEAKFYNFKFFLLPLSLKKKNLNMLNQVNTGHLQIIYYFYENKIHTLILHVLFIISVKHIFHYTTYNSKKPFLTELHNYKMISSQKLLPLIARCKVYK